MAGTNEVRDGEDNVLKKGIGFHWRDISGNAKWAVLVYFWGDGPAHPLVWIASAYEAIVSHWSNAVGILLFVIIGLIDWKVNRSNRKNANAVKVDAEIQREERLWVDRATVYVDPKTGAGVKIDVELDTTTEVDTKGLVLGLYPYPGSPQGSSLALRGADSVFSVVTNATNKNKVTVTVRPHPEKQAEFQEIAKLAQAGRGIRVVMERNGNPVAWSDGLMLGAV